MYPNYFKVIFNFAEKFVVFLNGDPTNAGVDEQVFSFIKDLLMLIVATCVDWKSNLLVSPSYLPRLYKDEAQVRSFCLVLYLCQIQQVKLGESD